MIMSFKDILKSEIEYVFGIIEKLMDLVDNDKLEWKPSTGSNWMTTGQLLRHLVEGSSLTIKGFITGNWGMPDGVDISTLPPEEMLPPAEKMLTVKNVAEAKQLLAGDRKAALDMLAGCNEKDLLAKIVTAPWDPAEMALGQQILRVITHLIQHKGQLFYYLKLQGKPVNTSNLW